MESTSYEKYRCSAKCPKKGQQIPGLSHLSLSKKRLQLIGLPTLAYRRVRGDMIEMYNILCKKYDQDVTDFIELRSDTTRRGHSFKIYKICPRLNIRKYSFIHRSVDTWNNLPELVVNAKTVKSFERRLDKPWLEQPREY